MTITFTQYQYLVTIHHLGQEMEDVHCIDLAITLGGARATISRMVKYLINQGLVLKNGRTLMITKNGYQIMETISSQYEIIYHYFLSLHLSEREAKECGEALMSHLSDATLKKLCVLLKK